MDLKLENAEINWLRFVFDDDVVSLGFPSNSTLEDVACSLDRLVPHHDNATIAIDITLATR
jgi:hypothetical protein